MYNKYTDRNKVLEALLELKKVIIPVYWEKNNDGKIIPCQKWVDSEFEISFSIYNDGKKHLFKIIKKKNTQYTNQYFNDIYMDCGWGPYIDTLKKELGHVGFTLFRYLHEDSDILSENYLEIVKSEYNDLLFDFISPSYIELTNTAMPKLSEKAVIENTTGEIKELSKLQRKRIKIQEKNQKKLAIKKINEQSKQVKEKNIIGNVCIKNITSGIIKRLPKPQALELLEQFKDQFVYCSKTEWRLQKASKDLIPANPKGLKQLREINKLKSKVSLRPKSSVNGVPIAQIIKKIIPAKTEQRKEQIREVEYHPEMVDVFNWKHLKDPNEPRKILKQRLKKKVTFKEVTIDIIIPEHTVIRQIRTSYTNDLNFKKKEKKYKSEEIIRCNFTGIKKNDVSIDFNRICIAGHKTKSPGAICKKLENQKKFKEVKIGSFDYIKSIKKDKKKVPNKRPLLKTYTEYTFPNTDITIKTYFVKRHSDKPLKIKSKKKWRCPIKIKSLQRKDLKKGVY